MRQINWSRFLEKQVIFGGLLGLLKSVSPAQIHSATVSLYLAIVISKAMQNRRKYYGSDTLIAKLVFSAQWITCSLSVLNKEFSTQVWGLCSLLLNPPHHVNPFRMSEDGIIVGKRGGREGKREGWWKKHLVKDLWRILKKWWLWWLTDHWRELYTLIKVAFRNFLMKNNLYFPFTLAPKICSWSDLMMGLWLTKSKFEYLTLSFHLTNIIICFPGMCVINE